MWADATFEFKSHKDKKDVQILTGVDDLTSRVDDSVVTLGNVVASPYVGPIRSEAEELAAKLQSLQVLQGNPPAVRGIYITIGLE